MRSLNRVTLLGHLGSDPEVRYTQGGTAIANFRIATNEQGKNGDFTERRRPGKGPGTDAVSAWGQPSMCDLLEGRREPLVGSTVA